MVVTAVESLALSFSYLRELLADSELWQAMQINPDATYEELVEIVDAGTLIGETSRERALEKIVGDTIPEEDGGNCDPSIDVPRIIIRYTPDLIVSRTSTTTHTTDASFIVVVETLVPSLYRKRSSEALLNQTLDQLNKIGGMLREWKAVVLANTAGRLQVDSWSLSQMGLVMPEQAQDINEGWLRTATLVATFQGVC